jgi:phosphatidate cytidylyltransferase
VTPVPPTETPKAETAAPLSPRAACAGPEFRLRVLSTLILVPLALAGLWLGGVAFAALIGVAVALMLAEWRGIIGAAARPALGFVLALVLGAAVVLAEAWRADAALALVVALALVAAFEPAGPTAGQGTPPRALLLAGVLYAGLPGLAAVSIRHGGEGMLATAFLFVVVWATDIGAYFAGRTLGGPKLWPRVSPKKTWSGALGGLLAAVVLGTGLVALFGAPHPLRLAATAALLSVASQAGDLYESSLKRRFGVKDSGTIIPGHGGVLDRFDGLVAALVVAWVIGALSGGTDIAAGLLSR